MAPKKKRKGMGEEPKYPSVGTGLYVEGFSARAALVGIFTACPGESSGEYIGAWASRHLANKLVPG